MENITNEMLAYRDATKYLWNTHFSTLEDSLRFGLCLELFEEIDELIFSALVCVPLKIECKPKATNAPIFNMKVAPLLSLNEVNLLINRAFPATGYWDDPVRIIKVTDLDLAFIEFFDWDEYNIKDCVYCRVRIIGCTSHPNLIDRDALIETIFVNFFWTGRMGDEL